MALRTALALALAVASGSCSETPQPAPPKAPPENVGVVSSALLSHVVFTIPAGKVSANLTNFPVLVRLTSHAGLIANARADGLDIRFYSDSMGTSLMDFEIESYSAGNLIAWVRVPTVSAASATTFYMRYGDNSSTNFENLNATWEAGYGAVWHMQENPAAAGSLQDSSGNGRHQVSYALTPTTDTASLIGNGTLLNQDNEYLSFPDFQTTGTTLTISAWWKTPSSLSAAFYNYVSKGASSNDSLMLAGGGTTTFQGRARNGGTTGAASGNVLVANAWNHIAMVYNGAGSGNSGRLKIYHNGSLIASPTYTGTIPASYVTSAGSLWRIGSTEYNAGYGLMGTADEIHVSSTNRSDAWIKAEYDNQVSGSTFYSTVDIPAANGQTCSVPGDCTSGYCVTGYCCPNSCDDSNACTVDSCGSSGVCSNTPGNGGAECRASTGSCDSAESCPNPWRASNVNAGLWTDYNTAPTWNCTAAGTTIVDTTGTGASCPAVSGDTCGGTATLTHCTNTVSQLSGSTSVMVVRLKGLTVSGGHVIRVIGDKPIVFLVDGDVTVGGSSSTIDASSYRSTTAPADGLNGPGAASFTCTSGIGGDGEISGGAFADDYDGGGGGGGGGFGATGGDGGYGDDNWSGTANGGPGGTAEGSLSPLRPGCRGGTGGAGESNGGAYGRGGGAIQISARGAVNIMTGGIVKANGAGGAGGTRTTAGSTGGGGGGGGGSGGAILIEGGTFTNNGTVQAIGGGGGGGGGSGGSSATVGGNGTDGGAGGAGGAGSRPGRAGGAGGTGNGTDGTNTTEVYSAGGAGGGSGGRTSVQGLPGSGPAAGGVCPADTVAVAGTVCRGTTGACDVQETCTGTSGVCPADAYASSATTCRATVGECDLAENCTGTAVACPSDLKRANGTACSSDGNACTVDQCNGTSDACQYTAGNPGASCRSAADVCDVGEVCTGTSTACPTDLFVTAGTSCRSSGGECDLAESCTGTAAACPADAKRPSGTACTADANVCTLDQCDGSAVTCQHPAGNAGTICNATTGVCDVAETCTGTSTSCPGNAYASTSVICRATVGECDAAEYCTGVSATCPGTDGKRAAGSACSSDGITCTADECNGVSDSCQHPAGNAGTVCRSTMGACDFAETCTGTSTACPADVLSSAGTVCRATTGVCDVAETCTGTSNACPSDGFVSSATECRALVAGGCDVAAESCTGTSGACPADTFVSGGTQCRATTGICDVVESCTGTSSTCPANAFASAATVCRATTGVCDAAELCTGSSASCPSDAVASSATPCRYQSNICDAVDFCTGVSGVCPADAYAPVGTDCGYTTGAVTIYSTGTPTNSALLNAGYSAASVTNAGPNSAWTDAVRYATTLPTTGANQFLYQQISTTGRAFKAYDLIEYDVYLADPQGAIGGLDIENGASALRGAGLSDQNGVGAHPASNLVANAYGTWYHRRIALGGSNMVNTTSTGWTIADENDVAHAAYTAYFDNVIVAATAGECNGANVCKIKTGYGCTAASDCATNVCSAVTLDASNTHRWALDTNANATIGGQNGTTSGTVTWSGGAAVLTGGGSGPYISVPTAVMSGLTDVTFEVWFSIDTHVTWQRIFDFGNDNTEHIFVTDRFDTSNVPRAVYRRDNGSEIVINSSTTFPTTTLTHVALSVDGATSMTLYVNGTASGSVALGGSDTLAAITFDQNYLGASQYADPRLDGNIYDFRIYNKALSATEVLATYRKGVDSKVCFAQYPLGISCTDGGECLSGFCVDGRCCNTACGGGVSDDCLACSVAAGAGSNGTCATAANGTVCRPSVDVTCDLAETCNGVATTCPADNQ